MNKDNIYITDVNNNLCILIHRLDYVLITVLIQYHVIVVSLFHSSSVECVWRL